MGNTHFHGHGYSRIRMETTVRRGEGCIQDVEKVYPRGNELGWILYSARQGIRSLPAKHILKNRQNRRLVLVPHDQYRRALTVKMKDRKLVIKMVTPVEQATEMVMAELKREWDALKQKKTRKPPTRQKPYTIKDWISF